MAIKEMQRIVDQAKVWWLVEKIVFYYWVGILELGEIVVIIVVFIFYCKVFFEVCEFVIDILK